MYTSIDYINLRGDIDFSKAPVCTVDQMIFTCLGKPNFTGVIPEEGAGMSFQAAYNGFLKMSEEQQEPGLLESPHFREILPLIANSERYKDITVSNYVRKIDVSKVEQFSALKIEGPDGIDYITFRGTDDTLVGWKENCQLAILDSVAAQRDAVEYLTKLAGESTRRLVVSGHSKGGNLAVYAAANASAEIQDRIDAIYSFDGPGFTGDFLEKESYLNIKDKITTFVPKASIVGMMMRHAGKLKIVDCAKEGVLAHDTFIWALNAKEFEETKQTVASLTFYAAFNELIDGMSIDQRQEFTDEVFDLLSSNGATELNDLTKQNPKEILNMVKNLHHAKELQKFILMLSGRSIKETITRLVP